ncbi:hypothetical protein MASR2M15_22580 [Anaerolineales bacterium]
MIQPGNIDQLKILKQIPHHWMSDLKWSKSGHELAVATGEGLYIYQDSLAKDAGLHLNAHNGPVKSVAFSADAEWIASGGADTYIVLWRRQGSTWHFHARLAAGDCVNCLAFSPDGHWLASGGADQRILMWRIEDQKALASFEAHEDEILDLDFGLKGLVLLSVGRDGVIYRCALTEGGRGDAIGKHFDWIRSLTISSDGQQIATASKDMSVQVRDIQTGQLVQQLQAHLNGADCVALGQDLLFTGGRDQQLKVWSKSDGHLLAEHSVGEKPLLKLALHPQEHLLLTGSGDNYLRIWGIL